MNNSWLTISETLNSVGLVVFIFVCYFIGQECQSRLIDDHVKLREAHVQMQRLERQQFHLKKTEQRDWLAESVAGLTYLKIGLDEFLSKPVDASQALVNHYDMSDVVNQLDYIGMLPVSTLRVSFDVSVPHALAFTEFYLKLMDASTPWWGEIRACEIDRQVTEVLRARCVLDIHHWKVT